MATINFDFKFDVDRLKFGEADRQAFAAGPIAHANAFENVTNAIIQASGNGLQGMKLRCYTRILNKLDVAVSNKQYSIELESTEVDLLKEFYANDSVTISPLAMRPFMQLREKIEALPAL